METLDVRYNSITVVPTQTAGLANLSSLLVYGNSGLTDNPEQG